MWLAYSSADSILGWLGPAGARVMSRLSAFLLPCIGTQITRGGVIEVLRGAIHP